MELYDWPTEWLTFPPPRRSGQYAELHFPLRQQGMDRMLQMKMLHVFVALLFLSGISKGRSDEFEITYPERLHHYRHKRDLSTATENGQHEHRATYIIRAFNKKWILDSKINDRLLPAKLLVRQTLSDGSESITEETPEHCHYQGSIRGIEDSTVALDTCTRGIVGVIDDGLETYHIEPHSTFEDTGAHKIQLASNAKRENMQCGVQDDVGILTSKPSTTLDKRVFGQHRHMTNVKDVYKPWLTTDETRYNEVLFTVDKEIFNAFKRDRNYTIQRVMSLSNTLDAIYQQINIRIVMKAIDIWTKDDGWNRTLGDLSNYGTYLDGLRHKIPHDNAHFLSHKGWPGAAGWAYTGAMCGSDSYGINHWDFGSIIGPYIVVGHEMGHNFNFPHSYDTKRCYCYSPKGCMMQYYPSPKIVGFTNCSLNALKSINDRCLYNVPTKAINSYCGNGIREGDEECDCGTPEMCREKDSCCLPHDCRLKTSATCSDLHHSCCKDCQFKKQGTLCRAVKTDCDVPEYCPGDYRDCPADESMQDGIPCNRTNKLILGNTNGRGVAVKQINPIEARYVRINPQYWYKWICMRTELYGCTADEVNPNVATTLKSFDHHCIVPADETCKLQENNEIIFRSHDKCDQKYQEFRLDANGVLWHECSQRRVCPESETPSNSDRLVISSTCKDDNSKFVRTPGNSLKHVKSGKCIHPRGGRPGDGRKLVLYDGCDVTRLEIWFIKPDCIRPLGIQDGTISDSQITATSYRLNDKPFYARLNNGSYWCTRHNDKKQHLQIDLGKTMRITRVATQGRGTWWYDWVTGYYLSYSQDGQRWTGYSESGDKNHSNSYCYLGKCAETRDTECRDLWGPATDSASQACWNTLNTEAKGYGTCDAASNSTCAIEDVFCGQLQCSSQANTPVIDYGQSYKKIVMQDSSKCSGAILKQTDNVGQGMVRDGTKCGDKKMCMKSKCRTFQELNIKSCPVIDGYECSGRGVCTSSGVCHCYGGYDPKTHCKKALLPINGEFSDWTTWSKCSEACGTGKQYRYRRCSNPFPKHGGNDCKGERKQSQPCNIEACLKAHSCRDLQAITKAKNQIYSDGVYAIYPQGFSKPPVQAYCDMSSDGGGWTLLVTSKTNTWKNTTILLRNQDSPSLSADYSILKYADYIKDEINVAGDNAEYRLEAETRGHWGGIWQFPRKYTFVSNTNKQTDVRLTTKFDDWDYRDSGVEKRMPWVKDARLTTSSYAYSNWWGTIAADSTAYHPAPWMNGHMTEKNPNVIWYWMREGPRIYPRSCMEVLTRMHKHKLGIKNGVYTIKPPGKQPIKTYCDLTSRGGGWTLLVTSKTHQGWTLDNIISRNVKQPSLNDDYSILGAADAIKNFDKSQDFFQYRIEADGINQFGGIFDAPLHYSFTSTCTGQTRIKLVENFNNISGNSSLATRMPIFGISADILLGTGSRSTSDKSGSIVYNDGSSNSPSYLPLLKAKPGVVRYWMREGTRRSCFDIKIHGERFSQSFKDGVYLVRILNESSYLPVYCDMTSDLGAYTLVVTSRHNSWTREQVPARNIYQPSINDDYSILKYADRIRDLSNNASYKFKLEAKTRGHWGGVWSAPKQYSFMATSNTQTNVHLLQKFNNWEFSWWQSLQNRMPWFDAKGTGQKALLTTSDSSTSYPAGSIIWGTDMSPPYYPAYWTRYGGMMDPGVIWYWVDEDDCDADRQPVDGGMSEWTAWSNCKRTSSGSRKRIRERTCTKPYRRCGGKSCDLESIKTVEEKDCFSFKGAISCHHLLNVAKSKGVKDVADGIYDIYPDGPSKPPISAYCDMSRDGGGWTLLVTSRTATWTKDNVILRNANKPSVTGDYSMLKYADVIKNNINVIGDQFEYRLEAQERGRWGGIWKASRKYTFTATTNIQTRVKLVKKFDDWIYMNNGIEERMPWVADAKLTTSTDQYSAFWGTITIGPNKHFKNAPWIYQKQNDPSHIWYWMREGAWQLPKSCMDVKLRGQIVPAKDGIYTIKPAGKQPIKTYCDLTSRGGGWTLLVTSKTHKGWTHDNIKSRNVNQPSLNDDYSILGVADAIKNYDQSQEFFQYRIEADGPNQYGGIFDAPKDYTFTATRDTQTDVELVENFNNFSQNANLATRMPRLGISADVLLSTGSESDTSGSIVYNDGSSNSPSYLPLLKDKPGVVRYWMREGTRRSCFDIKIHGERFSQSFKDGVYLVRLLNESSYLPVYCDMTSELGAYTLVVTSRHNSWTREQVPERNVYQPSIDDDYSILKYADRIRDLSNNATFKFKLEAKTRGHWGGVWSAPKQYSFMATSNTQTNVHLLQKFNNWEFSWWQSLQNRMPWFDAKGTGQKALLTTSSSSTSYPAGSIIWGTDMNPPYYPAYWTRYGGMMDPGVIWYWVNEDDCDADRLPVNGQLSEWSAWSKCDKLCSSEGKQRRYKTCSSPAPRCGGRHCQIKSENLFEERGCSSCPESPIRSYGGYCVQPKSEDCNPGQGGLALVFGPREANCSKDYMQFLFDSEGIIHHKCSGKIVCPWANTPKGGSGLLLLDDCPKDVAKHRRLPSKSLQNLNTKACVHPYNYYPSEGSFLGYWGGCDQTRMILDFFKLPPP